jgi:hypothetical protein
MLESPSWFWNSLGMGSLGEEGGAGVLEVVDPKALWEPRSGDRREPHPATEA